MGQLRQLRMHSQCLFPRQPKEGLLQTIRKLVGVNAQLPSAMYLSLRARVEGLTKDEIDDIRVKQRSVVRTWCMRGTMHLLASEDLAWLLSTLPTSLVIDGWRWLEQRGGLSTEKSREILDEAWQTLQANGPLTRSDLVQALTLKYGFHARAAIAGIVHLNGLLGRVCFGPDRIADPTYTALDNWLNTPPILSGPADYVGLARRFLQGYGPTAPEDLSAWWGCALSEAKGAWSKLKDELAELDFDGRPVWIITEPTGDMDSPGPVVRLLPAFDSYYLGYRVRDFAVPIDYQPRVFHGGEIAPVILLDGCAVGTWHYEQRGRQMHILAYPFMAFTPRIYELIAEEAADIGHFYHLEPVLSFELD
ncbi:MAG: winged helix DNA-binding domain-containing protein [Anaerolineaceae bacterium]